MVTATPMSRSSTVVPITVPLMVYSYPGLCRPTCIILHLLRLKLMAHLSAQSHKQSSALCSTSLSSTLLTVFPPLVSSANFITFTSNFSFFQLIFQIVYIDGEQYWPQDRALRDPRINWAAFRFFSLNTDTLGAVRQPVL